MTKKEKVGKKFTFVENKPIKGKYIIGVLDNILHSTNSFEIYNLFYPMDLNQKHIKKEKHSLDGIEATPEVWKRAMIEEKKKVDNPNLKLRRKVRFLTCYRFGKLKIVPEYYTERVRR